MAYYILTHGFGTNPAHHFTKIYTSYKEAKAAARHLFDIYQHTLETSTSPRVFTCLIQTRGNLDNGKKDDETKEATGKGHKKS